MSAIDWLLYGDPAIRWQVLRDLAAEDPDGLWGGGACFPASYAGCTTTCCARWTTSGGRGADPDPRMAEAVEVVRSRRQPGGRWLLDHIHAGRVHFDLEDAGAPSRWNTLRALRVLSWWDAAA